MDATITNDARAMRRARDAMNRALVACKDEILAERDARFATHDTAFAEHLRQQMVERESFADDLQSAVMSLGGRAEQEASNSRVGAVDPPPRPRVRRRMARRRRVCRARPRRRADRAERGLPGEKPFCKRCSAHGEQCLCAGIKLIEGKGH